MSGGIPAGFRFEGEAGDGDCLFRAIARQQYGSSDNFQRVRDDIFEKIMRIVSRGTTEEKIAFWELYNTDILDTLRDTLPVNRAVLDASPEYKA